MQVALHIKTEVLPGNKIEITEPNLIVGDSVDVFLIVDESSKNNRKSVLDIINQVSEQRLFKTSEEVDQYLQEERNSW